MRRIVCLCMIVVLFAAGCSEKEEMKSNELFYFVEEDGQHYIVPKEPLPEFSGHNAYIDWEIISVCFYSFDEMKYCIENGIFEYGQLLQINRFEKSEDGKIPIFDLSHFYEVVYPSEFTDIRILWMGKTYQCSLYEFHEDGIGLRASFDFCTKQEYDRNEAGFADYFRDLNKDNIVETIEPERNAKLYTYQGFERGLQADAIYSLDYGQKRLSVREHYTDVIENIEGMAPEYIQIYGVDNGCYFKMHIQCLRERPSVEWLAEFGVVVYADP